MGIGVLTISEAAKLAGVKRRTLHRWIVARAKVDTSLIIKLSGRKWLISKAALAAMLGLDFTNMEDAVDRHGQDIDAIRRRLSSIERRLSALERRR
jgi:excisionase family DNA binding protein